MHCLKYSKASSASSSSSRLIPMEFKIIHVVVNRIRSILILKARENNDHEIPEIMKKCWANLNSPNFQLPIKSMISEIRTMEKIFKQERTAFERSSANKEKTIKPNLTAKLKINDYTSENALLVPQSIISENAEGEQYVLSLIHI